VTVLVWRVSRFVTLTVAFGITASWGSTTLPVMAPVVVDWAMICTAPIKVTTARMANSLKKLDFFIFASNYLTRECLIFSPRSEHRRDILGRISIFLDFY
jgi:hypothetical protein